MDRFKGLFYWIIIISLMASSCKPTMKKANEAFNKSEYMVAADMFKKLTTSKDLDKIEKQEASFKAAEALRISHEPSSALKMYEKAQKLGMKDPIIIYRMAECEKQMGNYQEAIRVFKLYEKEAPSDPRTAVMIAGCEAALNWKNDKTRYTVVNFKPANESKYDDFAPMWGNKKKNILYFTTDRPNGASKEQYKWTGRNHTDVWMMTKEGKRGGEKWSTPVLVEDLNTKYNDGVITFNKRFNIMYITQCNGPDGKEPTCKIYEARKVGKGFKISSDPLPFCNDSFNYGHPSLSADESTLYFSSDRPGGYGENDDIEKTKDIWMVTFVKRGRTWSDPINLGPTVNTSDNEVFPYVHDDGTLYFSSDGHPGIGGLDIFETRNLGEPTDWETPKNMKSPINSKSDDFAIIMNETKDYGLFSSNREKDKDDIYEFFMEPINCTLKGQVTDCDSGTAIEGALVLISNNIDSSKIRLFTDSRGYYETPLNINTKYEINVSKRASYYYDANVQFASTIDVESSDDCQNVRDFCMKNTCNDVFVLPVYYDLDKAFIRADAKPVLDELVKTLKQYPTMKIELGSHTDCRSSFEYNRALSQRRADSAVAYILNSGINPFRLEARGYGESQLVNHCECEGNVKVPCSEQEHQQNRRTTVQVVNCNFDVKSIGVEYKLKNEAALEGQGSIYSPFLLEKQREYLIKTKGDIDSFERAVAAEEAKKALEKKKVEDAEKQDVIPLTKTRDVYYVNANVGKRKIRLTFDADTRRTELPQEMVEQLLKSGALKVENFTNSKEKIKLSDGTKIPGRSFTLDELTIGDLIFKKVKCKMVEEKAKPILGTDIFNKNYEDFEIVDGQLILYKILD